MSEWEDMKKSLKSTKGWDQLPHGLHLGIDMILATGDKEITRLQEENDKLRELKDTKNEQLVEIVSENNSLQAELQTCKDNAHREGWEEAVKAIVAFMQTVQTDAETIEQEFL